MSLQNQEGTYAQAMSNRLDSAVPNKMEAVSAPATFTEESVLYLDTAATVVFTPSGQATSVSTSFAAGWIPVRAIAVTSVSAGNLYRAY
jgi:hypothetical protein